MKPGNLSEGFLIKTVARSGEQIFSVTKKKVLRNTLCISSDFF